MLVMASKRTQQPFAPSIYEPEKRVHQYTLRLTDSEDAILEREAARDGITALNKIRAILGKHLSPRSSRRKRKR